MEKDTKTQPWKAIWPPAEGSAAVSPKNEKAGGSGMNGPTGYNDKGELLGYKKVEEAIKPEEPLAVAETEEEK